MKRRTTLQLSPETRARLAQHGRKCDTYEDIINKLIDLYEHDKLMVNTRKQFGIAPAK